MTFARNWAVFTSAFIFFKLGHSAFLAEEFVCGGPVKLEGAPWALLESHVWLAIKVSHSHIFSKTVHPNQNPTAPMFLATKPSKQDHVWMIFFLCVCVEQFFERGIIFLEVGIIVAVVWKNVPSYVMVFCQSHVWVIIFTPCWGGALELQNAMPENLEYGKCWCITTSNTMVSTSGEARVLGL